MNEGYRNSRRWLKPLKKRKQLPHQHCGGLRRRVKFKKILWWIYIACPIHVTPFPKRTTRISSIFLSPFSVNSLLRTPRHTNWVDGFFSPPPFSPPLSSSSPFLSSSPPSPPFPLSIRTLHPFLHHCSRGGIRDHALSRHALYCWTIFLQPSSS